VPWIVRSVSFNCSFDRFLVWQLVSNILYIYPLFEVMTPNGSYLSVGVILYQNLPNSFGFCHMRFHLKLCATYSRNHLFHMLLTSKPSISKSSTPHCWNLPRDVAIPGAVLCLWSRAAANRGRLRRLCQVPIVAWFSCFRPKTLRPFNGCLTPPIYGEY